MWDVGCLMCDLWCLIFEDQPVLKVKAIIYKPIIIYWNENDEVFVA